MLDWFHEILPVTVFPLTAHVNPSLCPQYGSKDAGGVGHVPPGWDQWHALVSHEQTQHSLLHSDQQGKAVCAAIYPIFPLSDDVSHL